MGQRQKEKPGIKRETWHNNLRGAWGFSPSIEKEKQDTGEEPGLQATMQPGKKKSQAYKATPEPGLQSPSMQASQEKSQAYKAIPRLFQEPGLQSTQARMKSRAYKAARQESQACKATQEQGL